MLGTFILVELVLRFDDASQITGHQNIDITKMSIFQLWASYNASVVKFSITGSLARFEYKNILFYFEKRSSLLQRWRRIDSILFLSYTTSIPDSALLALHT
jgi:hypothetical protein